jgi:hypothetical protein
VLARGLQAGDGALGRAQTLRPLPGSIHWTLSRLTSRARKGTVKGQTGPHRPRGSVHDTSTGASCSEHEGKIGSRVEEADGAGVHAAEAVCWTRHKPRRKDVGLLSVNGYAGAVWLRIWHGDYLEELTDSGG